MKIAYGYQVKSHDDAYAVMVEKSNVMLQVLAQAKSLVVFPWSKFDFVASCRVVVSRIECVQSDIYPLGSLAHGLFAMPEVSTKLCDLCIPGYG